MTHRFSPSLRLATAAITFAGLLACTAVMAAGPKPSEAQLRYQQDRAKCLRGETNQDRATCLKEAGAALQDSKNRTASGKGELARNRVKRCENLPAGERDECLARMNEGTTSGSARQGGVLRELTSPAK
jgi:hypothetical protein